MDTSTESTSDLIRQAGRSSNDGDTNKEPVTRAGIQWVRQRPKFVDDGDPLATTGDAVWCMQRKSGTDSSVAVGRTLWSWQEE